MLEIAPLNPIIFYGVLHFEHTWPKCYFQKFETGDTTRLQILADSTVIVNVRSLTTNAVVHSFPAAEIPLVVSGYDFGVYEALLTWADVGEGEYYIEVHADTETLTSCPIDVKNEFDGTLLFSYRNSDNNFNILFDTGIVFDLRVEGTIQNFAPKADDEIYNDEKRNATKLSSIPYQTFTLFIGGPPGLPDWMTDKVNRVMSCDMVRIGGRRIDGVTISPQWFEKVEGAEWEVKREPEYPFSGLELEIMPTNNLFLQRLKFDDNSDEMANKVLLRRTENRLEQSSNFSISGLFRDMTVLIYIRVRRRGLAFTFKVGTTPSGAEIGEFDVTEEVMTFQVRYPFMAPATIYISDVSGDNDFSFIYEQLDEERGGDGGDIPPSPTSAPIGSVWMYEKSSIEFAQDFDLVTGLGRVGTDWQGWAICNGSNGTRDMGGVMPIGWKQGDSKYGTIGDTGGAEEVTLTEQQLPVVDVQWKHTHGQRNDVYSGRDGVIYSSNPFGKNSATIDRHIATFGGGEAHDNMPPYMVMVFIKKIA